VEINLIRLRAGTTPVTAHSADLIPVRVWGANPAISGIEMTPGSITHIKKGVLIEVEGDSVVNLLCVIH
jgi:hypothetical protein